MIADTGIKTPRRRSADRDAEAARLREQHKAMNRQLLDEAVERRTLEREEHRDTVDSELLGNHIEIIPLGQLHRHPSNRVIDPSDPEIVNLAVSMSEHGQLEPLRVRRLPAAGNLPQYQIISGERRYTALISMGTFAAKCIVTDADDATALAEVAVANAHRKDLNPIERAELMQLLMKPTIEGGAGMTREQAGNVFGLTSESGCKNALRLLQLPDEIKQQIIGGNIPERVARAMVPYTTAPAVMKAIVKELRDGRGDELLFAFGNGTQPWAVQRMIRDCTRPLSKDVKRYYEWPISEQPCLFDITGHEADLQIVELPYELGYDHKMKRDKVELRQFALNVKLWDKLQQPFIEKIKKGQANKPKAPRSTTAKVDAVKLTPAQVAAEDKRKAAEAEKRINQFTVDWKHRLLRSHISQIRDDVLVTLTLPWLTSHCYSGSGSSLGAYSTAAMLECGLGKPSNSFPGMNHLNVIAGKSKNDRVEISSALAYAYWRVLLWPVSTLINPTSSALTKAGELPDRITVVDRGDIEKLCVLAGVSVETAWKAGATDSSDERRLIAIWLGRHTTKQLQTLAKQLGVKVAAVKRDGLVAELLAAHKPGKPLPLPKRLAKAST